jgi:hypothetical protein
MLKYLFFFLTCLISLIISIAYAQDTHPSNKIDFEVDNNRFFCVTTTVFFNDRDLVAIAIANTYDEFLLLDNLDDTSRNLIQTLKKDTHVKYHIQVQSIILDHTELTQIYITKIQPKGNLN